MGQNKNIGEITGSKKLAKLKNEDKHIMKTARTRTKIKKRKLI